MGTLFTIIATVGGVTGSAFLSATSNQTVNKILNYVGSSILQGIAQEGINKMTGKKK